MFDTISEFVSYSGTETIDTALVSCCCVLFVLFTCICYDLVTRLISNLVRIKK